MEKRDLYDKNRKPVGKTIYKGEEIPEGCFIEVVIVFMENKDGRFLIQKRADNGLWATTGGHPKSGETSLEGIIEEVKEEIGLDISKEDIKLLYTRKGKNVIFDVYYVNMEINMKDIIMQEEEVKDVKLETIDNIKKMIKNKTFHENHGKAFLDALEHIACKKLKNVL